MKTRRRTGLGVALALAVGVSFLAGCGDDSDDTATASTKTTTVQLPVPVDVTADAEVTSSRTMDIYAPTEGGPWPVVVMWHGQPYDLNAPNGERQRMAPLAEAVAAQGAVVFNVSYGAVRPQDVVNDTACSLQLAVEQAVDHGGDPERLVLAGQSFGAALALMWGLDSPLRTEPFEDCVAEAAAVDVMPDAAVAAAAGIDAHQLALVPTNEPWQAAGDEYLDNLDARQLVGGNPDLKVFLAPQEGLAGVFATPEQSVALHEALLAAGYESTILEPQLAGPHGSAVNPDSPEFSRLVDFVVDAVDAVR